MKRFLSRQLTNIVFLVLIVGAALAIYLLSRGESAAPAASQPEETTALSPTSEQSAYDSETAAQSSPRGIPASVFLTHLETSDLYEAEQSKNDAASWTLTYASDASVAAALVCETSDGCVSALEITFTLLQVYDGKAGNSIEQYLKEHSAEQSGETPEAVRALLSDLLPVCDTENRLSVTTARYWAEQALLLEKDGADFEDTQSGCHFIAYRTSGEGKDLLVCTMIFN